MDAQVYRITPKLHWIWWGSVNVRLLPILLLITLTLTAQSAQALQPVVLNAEGTEDGIVISWTDTGAADAYVLERIGPDGSTAAFTFPGSQTSFLDDDVELGTYTYLLTAQRSDGDDTSNPATALAWPGCLPWISLNPVYVSWESSCYCPFPPELEDVEYLLCD